MTAVNRLKRGRNGRNQRAYSGNGAGGSGYMDHDGSVCIIMAAEILQQYSFNGAVNGDSDFCVRFLWRKPGDIPFGMFSGGIAGIVHGTDTVNNQRHTDDTT